MEEEAGKRGINLDIVKTGCQGLCQKGPVMKVEPQGIFYQKLKPGTCKSDYKLYSAWQYTLQAEPI